MSTLRSERGMTLVEVLVASVLALVVFGATMTALVGVNNSQRRQEQATDSQDQARTYLDRLARQLRNLASPSLFTANYQAKPNAVDLAGDYDFVFRVVGDTMPAGSLNTANVKRVRYCLDATDPTQVLYQQEQTWTNAASNTPPALPSTASCPGTGWTTTKRLLSGAVNRIDGQDRPLFTYNSSDPQRISEVHSELFVDTTPGTSAKETRLATGVTLRNQNRVPTASMTVTVGPMRHVILNGSASEDAEGMPLTYQWYLDPPATLPDCDVTPAPVSCIGTGVVFEKDLTAGQHHIVLLVKDPAGLPAIDEDTRQYSCCA
jgi:type II secretory pathway pseudopilin PulG